MTNKVSFFLSCIIALQGLSLSGQLQCAFDEIHSTRMNTDQEYRNQVNLLNQRLYDYSYSYNKQKIHSRSKPTYTVPIVVHIVTPAGVPVGQGNNLTNLQVEEGLAYLNQAFANQGVFAAPNGVDIGISFCLAKRDPNGLPTNGITRNESPFVSDTMCGPGTNAISDSEIKKIANWDCNQYINIWLVTDLFNVNFGCGLAGYAYYPGASCLLDGIVQESRYWNSISGTSVTAHEMGHYFSLNHTFNGGCVNTDCLLDGDRVCDTPPDDSPAFSPCNTNSCNTDLPDLPDDNSNYMDYTSCLPNHFTDGQRVRMIGALETRRGSLLQSKGCQQVGNYDVAILDIGFGDFCSDTICANFTIRNEGLRNFNSLFINYSIDGVPQTGFLWSGNLNPNQTTIIQNICFNVPVGKHTLVVTLGNPDNQVDFFISNNILSAVFESFPPLKVLVESITPTHCISDGTITLIPQGGTAPYTYKISNHSFTQSDPFFQLLLTGNYTITITDNNLCTQSINVTVPDSCIAFKNDTFKINKDAVSLGNGCYILTQSLFAQVGSVWYEKKANLNESFDVYFDINLGCMDNDGADGIAFVLQPISTSIGIAGSGLGYQGIIPSLAVEFDTWENTQFNDPLYDHIAIMRNGNINHFSLDNVAGPLGILAGNRNAEDCNFHKVLIRWNAISKTLEVYVDCLFRLRYTNDIVRTIFNGDPNVFFGFTAATGALVNTQQVCFNYVSAINKLPDYIICKGESIQLTASAKFNQYKWSPSTGLSRIDIENPIFQPDTTTTYFLEQTDNCGFKYLDTLTIQVNDFKLVYAIQLNDSCASFIGATLKILNNSLDTTVFYSLDGKNYTKDTIFQIANPGKYTIYAKTGNCIISEIIDVTDYKDRLRDSVLWIQALNCKDSGRIVITGLDGVPPYQYRINNGVWQNNGEFDKLLPGIYSIETRDQTACIISRVVEVNTFTNTILIQIDSSQLKLNCCTPDPFISVHALGSLTYYYYSLDSLSWTSDGLFRNLSPGTHTIVARDEFGCTSDTLDFEVLNQMIFSKDTQHINLCEGESVQVGNDRYVSTGIYTNFFKNIYCCDSIIITNLIVDLVYSINNSQVICDGDEIVVGVKKYNTSGNFIDTLQSIKTCDSVILTNLKVNPVFLVQQSPIICNGEMIFVGNNTYRISGDYIDSLQTINGCDSVINTNLTVNPVHAEIQNHNICKAQFVKVGSKLYQQTGTYLDTLSNIFGCDSVITTQLFVDTILASIAVDSILCFNDDNGRITLNPLRGIPKFSFSFDDPNDYSVVNVFEPLKPGNYTLYLKDSLGCIETFLVTLLQPLELMADLVTEIKIKLGEKIVFNPLLNFIPTKIEWFPATGLSCIDCLHPEVQPLGNIEYEVIFTNEYDCEISARVKILVDNQTDFYVPNAFSPNSDQINDRLMAFGGESIQEVLVFSIYNRWGVLVFENKNFQVNDFDAGWDGTMNGEKLNPGVFVYYAKARRIDGTEVKKMGDVTLIR